MILSKQPFGRLDCRLYLRRVSVGRALLAGFAFCLAGDGGQCPPYVLVKGGEGLRLPLLNPPPLAGEEAMVCA
jgi:hypothetical protein